ncbi:MAG: hypothetical protein ACOC04_03925 [Halothece sp.]
MSNPRMGQSGESLTIGNVVSAGLRIYRDRFKTYYSLAFRAYLWILVPIYGWAKFGMLLGLISRLAFQDVIERPETVSEAQRHVKPRLWTFFVAGLLVFLIIIGSILGISIVFGIIFGVLGAILSATLGQSAITLVVTAILGIAAFFLILYGYLWVFTRISIVECPIAIEGTPGASAAVGRSWNLTKGSVSRLVAVFFVAFLITIPISIVVQIATYIGMALIGIIFPPESALFNLFYSVFVLAISFASGALLIPFWQGIKAVIYYDLRSRREGLGLNLGKPNLP